MTSDLLIPVLRGAKIKAWPKHEQGGVARYLSLYEVLTSPFKYDAHFCQYCCPRVPRRLDSKALTEPHIKQLDGFVAMMLIVFDVDGPNHQATPEWRASEREKVSRLLEDHPGVYMYDTRHGYRLLARIQDGTPLESPRDANKWTFSYLADCAYLKRVFDIQADPLGDWTRLFRAPCATRDEGGRPENLLAVGDPKNVGEWLTEGKYIAADIEAAKELGKKPKVNKPARKTSESVDYHGRGVIGRLLSDDGLLGSEKEPGMWMIKCPLHNEHSKGEAYDDSCVYYEPTSFGHYLGTIDCLHESRGHHQKTSKDWLQCWSQDRIDSAREAEGLPAFNAPKATSSKKELVRIEGAEVPIDFNELDDPNGPDGVAVADEPKVDPHWGNLTDVGNGERFVAQYGNNAKYCPPKKCWYIYTGTHYQRDDSGTVQRMAKQTIRSLYVTASETDDPDRRAAIFKHALKSEASEKINAMLTRAQYEPGVAILPEQMDANPWLFNCANGVLDLKTCKLLPHDRKYLMTRISPATFKPGAKSKDWEAFLVSATNGDTDLQAYVQKVIGYCLSGVTTEKCFFFIHGEKDTGKSVFAESISTTLGTYASTAAFSTWCTQTNTGGNRGDLVRLSGDRLVCSVEVKKGAKFDEEIVKAFTGGDRITAAAKFENEVSFVPQCKILLAANDAPRIRDDDDASWSRVRRIPFNHSIPLGQQDKHLRDKLATPEAMSAILWWASEGCGAWQVAGDLGTCKAVDDSVSEYRAENDRALGFISGYLEFFDSYRCNAGKLREAYEQWCKDAGVKSPLTGNELGERLKDKGAEPGKSNGVRYWKHVRLAASRDEDEQGRQGLQGSPLPSNSPMRATTATTREETSLGATGDPVDDVLDREEYEAEHAWRNQP